MTKSTSTKSTTPQDRLTRICDDMIATFNTNAEKRENDRAIVFLVDEIKGGIGLAGYEDDTEALLDLIIHLRAIFRARGQDIHFVPVGMTPPKDRT